MAGYSIDRPPAISICLQLPPAITVASYLNATEMCAHKHTHTHTHVV